MKLTARQIERLVKQGEVVHTECKDASAGLPDSLWESYSSFANTDGGVILLGVKEVNPGTMRISKEVAIEGGRSDPRNAQVFNIFSLTGIGERSGTGLSNLYALWEQHGFATPVIREEFDPEKTIVNIATESNQSVSDNTRTEPDHNPDTTRTEPDQDPSKPRPSPAQSAQGAPRVAQGCPKSAPRVAQGCPKSAPRVPQTGPRSAQDRPKLDPKSAQDQSEIGPRKDGVLPDSAIIVPSELRNELASVRQVYKAIVANPKATYRGLAVQLDFAKDTIGRAIATLIRLKIIRREGNKQTGHWEVVK